MTNNDFPDFDEASISQIPAIAELCALGYQYIPRARVNELRAGRGQYILRELAVKSIARINPNISEKSIIDALIEIENANMDGGIIKASENIYSDLIAGKAVSEIINGRRQSPQMNFIDFKNPANNNNDFYVCAEFEISEITDRRPDIVLFINGLPIAVIECKRGSVDVREALDQMWRNQQGAQTPKFFLFPQILIGTNGHAFKYGTMLTPPDYYSVWKEPDAVLPDFNPDPVVVAQICRDLIRNPYNFAGISDNEQSRGIYNLLRPERILDIIKGFVFYDGGIKKIARYQQYFAIQKTMVRVMETPRRGGLIWHTQGSGKSLTMVMLVRELTAKLGNPRIIILTDRRDLQRQIKDTFAACNIKKNIHDVKNSTDLEKQIKGKNLDVLFTLVQKFGKLKKSTFVDKSDDIFVLVDEAHRTQGGEAHAFMKTMMPNACYIGFTGTPLMKAQKKDEVKWGGYIDKYTISEAEADGAILPLVYQARYIPMTTHKVMLDEFYNRITATMTEPQKKDFEAKARLSKMMADNNSRIEMIALDIHDHYIDNFQNTGLKGQIVMPSKYAAVMCKHALDLLGGVSSEVIISGVTDDPDDDNLPEMKAEVAKYLKEQERLYGKLEKRETAIIDQFKKPGGVELLIVVDKLLTGFDAPRDTVLYLAKQLKDHNLLQAIARVNRTFGGDAGKQKKTSGLIVDYSMNAKALKDAMILFSNFNPDDINGALISTDEKVNELRALYDNLRDTFKGMKNPDEMLNYLKADEHEVERDKFYNDVNRFINVFSNCLALPDFQDKFSSGELEKYSLAIKQFAELKKTTRLAMGEVIDFSKYRDQLHKILDKYVSANKVEELSKEINLSDVREFNQFVEDSENGMSARSKAEAIAAQTKKIIKERYNQDAKFYQNFSDRIDKLLDELRAAKKEDIASLFDKMKELQSSVDNYEDSDIPEQIRGVKITHPFFRNLKSDFPSDEITIAGIVSDIVKIIQSNRRVDWQKNIDVERNVKNEIDDYLYDYVRSELGLDINPSEFAKIEQAAWDIAVNNYEHL
jgi:type I restriction enzyme R subunit